MCGLASACPQSIADVAELIETAPKTHPRLFMNTADAAVVKQKVLTDPQLSKAFAHVKACAAMIEMAEPVRRKKLGRRLLSVSRTCLKRVVNLAFAYRMTGAAHYLQRAEAEMLILLAQW